MYQKVPLTLTGPQLRKLHLGQTVQLTNGQLNETKHYLMLHPETAKKIATSLKKGKGCRMQCCPQEIEMSGEGLADIWHWIKNNAPKAAKFVVENVPKVAKFVKENVIDSPFYQENIRPKAHNYLTNKLESMPYADATIPLLDLAARETGAFGLKKRAARPKTKKVKTTPIVKVVSTKPKTSTAKPKPKPKGRASISATNALSAKPKAKRAVKPKSGGSFKV